MNLAKASSGASIGKNIVTTLSTYCSSCLVPTNDLKRVIDIPVKLLRPIHDMIVDTIR